MLKIGTDFSGIGSPESALKRLGLEIDEVFACELDKYARKSFLELHDPTTFYNDITTRNHSEAPQLDLYVAGFPCQAFSMAGNRRGFEEARGTLFFNVAEFIKENQPKCFILENVKGLLSHDSGRTYQTITDILHNGGGTFNGQIGIDTIDNGLGYHIYTKVLNTKDYGVPQNRERIFIVGFKEPRDFNFPKKMPLKLRLKDLLENEVDDKYYLSDKRVGTLTKSDRSIGFTNPNIKNVANCLIASYNKLPTDGEYIVTHSLYPRSSKTGKGGSGHLSKSDGTSYCVDTGCSQGIEVAQLNQSKESGGKQPYQQNRVYCSEGLSPCLDTDSSRRNIQINETNNKRVNNCFNKHKEDLEDGDFMDSYNQTIHKEVSPTITTRVTASNSNHIYKTKRIRRLTPLECWRLQGFTDEQFYKAQAVNSDTQLYKQAGNSITVNVMVELLKKIYLK